MTDREYASSGARSLAKKYALTREEAIRLASREDVNNIIDTVESYRWSNALHPQSPIIRGLIRDLQV